PACQNAVPRARVTSQTTCRSRDDHPRDGSSRLLRRCDGRRGDTGQDAANAHVRGGLGLPGDTCLGRGVRHRFSRALVINSRSRDLRPAAAFRSQRLRLGWPVARSIRVKAPLVRLEVAMTVVLIGFGVTLTALVIQGAAATVGVELIGVLITKRWLGIHVWRNGVATIALIVVLLIGHFGQMALWASAFMAAGEFETFAVAFYH